MKKMFYLSLFLIIGSFSANANIGYLNVDGFYINGKNYSEIQIKEYRRGIKVRGLNWRRPNKWIKFERINRKRFVDCDNNQMVLNRNRRGDFTFILKDRFGQRTKFRRVNSYNRNNCGGIGDGYFYDGNGYNDHDFNRRDKRSNNGRNTDKYRFNDNSKGSNNSGFRIEGTYSTRDGRSIAIVETRRGFKAKFSGDRTWKSYEKKNNRFIDKDGNSYTLQDDGGLIWKGKYSGKRIELSKVSDEVNY